jgi:murein DD-endopeptidase MepM/ murein hydrolase activator NlpD
MCWKPMMRVRMAAMLGMLLGMGAHAAPPGHGHARHKKGKVISSTEAHAAIARKEQLRRKLSGLHRHMHSVRAKIHTVKVKEYYISENIGTVEGRISHTRASLGRVRGHLRILDRRHTQVVNHLEATWKQLATRRHLLTARLNDTYERGQISYAQVLVRSRSVHDLLSRGYYVRQVVHSDAELIEGVQQDVRQIASDKKVLEEQARRQKALAEEFETQKQHLASDLEKKQVLLAGVQEQRQEAEEELDGLAEEAAAMTDNIRELSEALERRRRAEAAERAAQAAQNHHHVQPRASTVAPIFHGSFIRPVSARVTSGFGSRFHPILHRTRMHTGVDFGAPYGASIHAAGGGTVILAHYSSGYGNCVVIDHGNGVTTLYGHCSALLVSTGDIVQQGQTIARVGATGMATGPHLHFEVRHSGVPVNPL